MRNKSKNWKCYYDVSFEIISYKDRLEEISKRIGCDPGIGSCDIGGSKGGKKTKYAWWRSFTRLPKKTSLNQHLDYLVLNMERTKAFKKGVMKKEYKVIVSIAKYFNTEKIGAPGFYISKKYLNWFSKRNASLELISYPCEP